MARGRRKAVEEAWTEDDSSPPAANSEARAQIIREAIRDIASLEAERKSISEQIRSIKQTRIKGDLGMKIADFQAAYRLYCLEDESRNTFFDAMRETFSALGVGEQLNWLDAADAA